MPNRLGGLCKGAISQQALMPCNTSPVISTLSAKRSPPCTTRWPTASISDISFITPYSLWVKALRTILMPTTWSGISSFKSMVYFPTGVCFKVDPSMPMRSTSPLAITFSPSILISWYLMEELPQFTTNTITIRLLVSYTSAALLLLSRHSSPRNIHAISIHHLKEKT